MAKFKSLASETVWVDVAGRLTQVEPGAVLDVPAEADVYVQTGETGEDPLFSPVVEAVKKTGKTTTETE